MHTEVLKACLGFSLWVVRTEVDPELRDKHGIVREPGYMFTGGEGGFESIECSSMEV